MQGGQLLATYRGREPLALRARTGISPPENCGLRRPSRGSDLGVLQLFPSDFKGAASTFAQAQRALSKVAIWYPGWGNRLKLVGCLAVVTVVSFLYFAGLIDIKSVHGFQSALLATP